MNSSFSRSRFGVISRMSSARCAVWIGGSNVSSWSLIGSASRCCSMSALTSSPSSGTGKPGNGPVGELHDENVVGVVVDRDRFVVAGHHHHAVVRLAADRALRAQPVEVRVRVGDELVAAEEVDRVVVVGRHRSRLSIAGVVPVGPIGSARGLLAHRAGTRSGRPLPRVRAEGDRAARARWRGRRRAARPTCSARWARWACSAC